MLRLLTSRRRCALHAAASGNDLSARNVANGEPHHLVGELRELTRLERGGLHAMRCLQRASARRTGTAFPICLT
jgi:hypothetical protein